VWAIVQHGPHVSTEVGGIIDSGSVANLTSISLARRLLGMSQDDVKKTGRKTAFSGLNAKSCPAYGFQVNLNLRATLGTMKSFALPNAWLYFYDSELPYQILIGQSHGLQGRAFFHLNGGRKQHWTLRDL